MSGAGSRFSNNGYNKPKPLIEFFGKTMIEHVLENLGLDNTYILCVLREHYDNYPEIFDNIKKMSSNLHYVIVDKITEGPAATCLLAKQYINPEEMLLIANCDQMMVWNQKDFESFISEKDLDGAMFIFDSDSNKNSYVEIDDNGLAVRTAEKEVISPYATTGIYVWTKGIDFIHAAENMISKNIRANNEFYVAPCYNESIEKGLRIGIYRPDEHWPIGVPEDLMNYIEKHVPMYSE